MKEKVIAMIPARYAATRFPGKLMQELAGKTIIRHTYDNTLATGLFDEVIVVTDSEIIFKEITGNGGRAVMSVHEHESGTDRIAEAAATMDVVCRNAKDARTGVRGHGRTQRADQSRSKSRDA